MSPEPSSALARDLVTRALNVLDAGPRHDELEIVAMLLRDALNVLDEQAEARR